MKKSEADEFARSTLQLLRARYQLSPNTQLVYTDGIQALEQITLLNHADTSFYVGALEGFLADVLLALAPDASAIIHARDLSDTALARIEAMQSVKINVIEVAIHTALVNSIASKALGDRDKAFQSLEMNETRISRLLDTNWVDLIPLRRQRVLLAQRKDDFIELANDASKYRYSHPAEYYASLKRFFEYLLNQRYIDLARESFPALQSAYKGTALVLPLVAKVSFLKNTGHYLILEGSPRKGMAFLTQAISAAVQFNLHGQARQIAQLIQEAPTGNPILHTFSI
jgi:hypothetical protein